MELVDVAVVGIALWVWVRLLLGLTYYVRKARILTFIRAPLVLKYVWFARLVACGQCTSTWTGPIAYALLWPIVYLLIDGLPFWTLAFLPLSGPVAAGVFDKEERAAFGEPIDRLTKVLTQGPSPSAEEEDVHTPEAE